MGYEIPQQLEYKEKIMFGLTFKQLAYAFLFGMADVLIMKRVHTLVLKVPLLFVPSILAVCFMFFDLDVLIRDYWGFLKLRKLNPKTSKLERFIGLKEIKDKRIICSNNKRIAVLRVNPINFSIKPNSEKEALMESFQKLLNSFDFPIQIMMNTESIELNEYMDALKSRIRDSVFDGLFEKYREHLRNIILNNKIMNRIFYLVIPENSDIEIQMSICLERLESLNLKAERLNDEELESLLVKSFQGKGKGLNLTGKCSTRSIVNHISHLEVNSTLNRVIYAFGYPRKVEAGFLDRIVSSLGDFDLSIHLNPYPIETMIVNLNRELQKQRADLYSLQLKGMISPSLDIKYEDTKKTLEQLQKGNEKLFNISLYINCKAQSIEALNLLSRKVESELNSLMIIPKNATFRMLQGYKSTLPLGIDELKAHKNITTKALSAFFPFTSQFFQVDKSGVWLGLNKNKIPIIRDIFTLPNPNGLVLAQSGGGKSYFCKLLISRYLLNGTKVMVIDPQGEYRELVKYFGGQRINLSRTSDTIINPLDLMGHDYAEKRLSLMDLMQVMLGELTEPQKSFIDKALNEAYEKKGISHDPATWDYEPPILSDVLEVLVRIEKRAITLEKTTIRSLINRLTMYTDGVFSFLNKHTSINFNNRFVCFDIGSMPKQVKPAVMFMVLDYVYMKMKTDLERKILLIDEAWSLLSRTEDATYIFEIVKTCRKFNMGLLLINQETEGLLSSEVGKSVLANSAYTLLMRQKPAVIKSVCDAFHLSSSERTHLLTANVGEGILIMEDDHTEIRVVASDEEHRIITTNADELIGQGTTKEEPHNRMDEGKTEKPVISDSGKLTQRKERVSINVDEHKGFYRHKDLSLHELKYLLSKKYEIIERQSITSKKSEKFLVKAKRTENASHVFLVHDIAEYIRSLNLKVMLFETNKPDLVFQLGKEKVAIEVETGKVLKSNKSQLLNKVRLLNKEYSEWFFVVTDRNIAPKYKVYGKVIDKRAVASTIAKIIKKCQPKTLTKNKVHRGQNAPKTCILSVHETKPCKKTRGGKNHAKKRK